MKTNIDVSFEYLNYSISNKKIILNFDVSTINFNSKKVDKKDVEKEISKKLGKYIKIISYKDKKLKVEFDPLDWMNKNLSTTIIDTADKFEKRLKLKKLPQIVYNIQSYDLAKVIEGTFRNYLKNNDKLRNKLISSIKTNMKLNVSFFKISYDSFRDYINFDLKQEFRIKPFLFTDKSNKEVKKVNFDKSVYSLLGIK